jgi:hypothetical protein
MLAELLDAVDPIASDDGGEPFLGQELTKQLCDARIIIDTQDFR